MPGKLETGKVENIFFVFFRFCFHFLHRFSSFSFSCFFSFCKFVVNFGFHFFILVFIFFSCYFFVFSFWFSFFSFWFSFLFHFSLASVIFGGLKPSLANLIWTKPAKTEAHEKKRKKKIKKMKKTSSFFHFWRFETFTGKPHLDETSKNRGK